MRIVTDSLTEINVTLDLPISATKAKENPTEIISVVTVQTTTAVVCISTMRNGQTVVVTSPGTMICSVVESVTRGASVFTTTDYSHRHGA